MANSFATLKENGFMETVDPINFNDPATYHNRVIIVEEKKFYVLKEVLSLSSDYFRTLFNSNFDEAKKEEIILEDMSAKSFEYFLNIIYPEHLRNPDISLENLNDASVMLELVENSFRFLCPVVFREAKKAINKEYSNHGLKRFDFITFVNVALLHDVEEFKIKIVEALQDHSFAAKNNMGIINAPENVKDFVLTILLDENYPTTGYGTKCLTRFGPDFHWSNPVSGWKSDTDDDDDSKPTTNLNNYEVPPRFEVKSIGSYFNGKPTTTVNSTEVPPTVGVPAPRGGFGSNLRGSRGGRGSYGGGRGRGGYGHRGGH